MQDTFNGGYTKAILDVLRWFEDHDDDLRYCHAYTRKGVLSALRALLECREELRETGGCGSLVWNPKTKEFRAKLPGETFYHLGEMKHDY